MYFDTSYIAKFYLNESGSSRVRALVRKANAICSSLWAMGEFHAVLHRHLAEGVLLPADARDLASRFSAHVQDRLWNFIPLNDALLRRTSALMLGAPSGLFIRTADAVHLTTALEIGEPEVWTNDRHMLAAAAYFGLEGRSV